MMTDTLDGKQVITSKKLCFLLAIAGRLDAMSELSRSRREKLGLFAQKADASKIPYYPFAVLDGWNLSYSMLKYYFDAVVGDEKADFYRDTTPEADAGILAGTLFVISFSLLASIFDGEEKDNVKKRIAIAWPYARDVMKALKNSYKGFRAMIQVAGLLGGRDLMVLLFPAGLALSIISAANRLWLRYMINERKDRMKNNARFLSEIKPLEGIDSKEELDSRIKTIEGQTKLTRGAAFAGVAFAAITDSMYYYIGMLTLASLTSPVLWPLMVICLFYSISCIATRLYEEYFFQKKLIKTQVECELNLLGKRLNTVYKNILEARGDSACENYKDLLNEFADLCEQFDTKRNELCSFSKTSYKEALLIGLSQGLYAHGTLSCALFIVSMALALSFTAFPPALLITGVVIGMAFMAAFVSRSLILNWANRRKQDELLSEERRYQQFEKFNKELQENPNDTVELLSLKDFESSLQDGLVVEPIPESNIQDWFEVVRSFFSGVGKGQKITDYPRNLFMETNDHTTPVVLGLMITSCVVFSITRAFRALAKGLGRPSPGAAPQSQNDILADTAENITLDDNPPPPAKPVVNPKLKTDTALPRNSSYPSIAGFFGRKKPDPIQYPKEDDNTPKGVSTAPMRMALRTSTSSG